VIVPGESDALSPRESYEKFCDDRQKLIARGFADWLREETPTWSLDRRIRPTPRLFPPYAYKEDRIRALNYPAEQEDTLLAHVDNPKFRLDKGQSNEPPKLINLRDDSKRTVQLKPLQDRIEITAKNEAADPRMSRLAVAGGLEVISETQWHLRIDSTPPAAAASVLSTLLDEVLGAKS
jgi:hypothetical protein